MTYLPDAIVNHSLDDVIDIQLTLYDSVSEVSPAQFVLKGQFRQAGQNFVHIITIWKLNFKGSTKITHMKQQLSPKP